MNRGRDGRGLITEEEQDVRKFNSFSEEEPGSVTWDHDDITRSKVESKSVPMKSESSSYNEFLNSPCKSDLKSPQSAQIEDSDRKSSIIALRDGIDNFQLKDKSCSLDEPKEGRTFYQGFFMLYPMLASRKTMESIMMEYSSSPSDINAMAGLFAERAKSKKEISKISKEIEKVENEIRVINEFLERAQNDKKKKEEEMQTLKERYNTNFVRYQKIDMEIIELRDKVIQKKTPYEEALCLKESDDLSARGYSYEVLCGHMDTLNCLDFDLVRGIMATGSLDKTVKIWNLRNNECILNILGHSSSVNALQLSRSLLITGSSDRVLKLWNLEQEMMTKDPEAGVECVKSFCGHLGKILCLKFDSKSLLSGSSDSTIRRWDLETGKLLAIIECSKENIYARDTYQKQPWNDEITLMNSRTDDSFAYSADDLAVPVSAIEFRGHALVSAHHDGIVRLWDIRTGNCHETLVGHMGKVNALDLHDFYIMSGGSDGTLRVWDIRSKSQVGQLDLDISVNSISSDGPRIIAAVQDCNLRIGHRESGSIKTLEGHKLPPRAVKCAEDTIISGGEDMSAIIWKLQSY